MVRDRWRNRRRMAWATLIAALAYPLLILGAESDQLGAMAMPFYTFCGAVMASYFGFATADDKWQQDKEGGA